MGRSGAAVFSAGGLLLTACLLGCVPSLGPFVLDAAEGRVRDRDTGEPLRDAEVIEWYRGAGRMGGPQPELYARFARSDAGGRFAFPRQTAWSARLWLLKSYGPAYSFYHPSYGLEHGARRSPASDELLLEGSLRDSAARLEALAPWCRGEHEGRGARRIAELACPPREHERWPDGTPRARGDVDARGRRIGTWTFFYEDGTVAARGRYQDGAPLGAWEHYDRRGALVTGSRSATP